MWPVSSCTLSSPVFSLFFYHLPFVFERLHTGYLLEQKLPKRSEAFSGHPLHGYGSAAGSIPAAHFAEFLATL